MEPKQKTSNTATNTVNVYTFFYMLFYEKHINNVIPYLYFRIITYKKVKNELSHSRELNDYTKGQRIKTEE